MSLSKTFYHTWHDWTITTLECRAKHPSVSKHFINQCRLSSAKETLRLYIVTTQEKKRIENLWKVFFAKI
jgi:hypothetical protein